MARREARATDEYLDTVFIITELERFECQTRSGKSLDCVATAPDAFLGPDNELHLCQCEDDWRLRQSGYTLTVACKHVIMLRQWLLDTPPDDRWLSLEFVAQFVPYALRTLEAMCKRGFLPADKIGRQWAIPPSLIDSVIADLIARIVPLPPFSDEGF
jgi:hypothetical protein